MAVVALLVVAAGAVLGTAPAQAGVDCDPFYGCEPTTTLPAGVLASCVVSTASALPGQQVDVTITNVPDGLSIDLLFDGAVVASGTAAASAFGSAAPGFADVDLSFLVPSRTPGTYTLEAVGPAFQTTCTTGGFQVLANTITRPNTGGGGGGVGAGSLARTGIAIALLLAIALALLVAGRAMVEGSRRTRRAAESARDLAPRGKHAVDPGGRETAR